MKKIRLICIAAAMAAMLSSTVSVQASGNALDLDNSLNIAVQNSYKVKSMDITIQKDQYTYKNATKSGSTGSDLEAKYSIYRDTNLKKVTENAVKLDVYEKYISFINAKDALDLAQQEYQNAEAKYKKAQLQLSLGTISKVEAKSAEQTFYDGKAQLNKAQRSFDLYTKSINQVLGGSLNTTYDSFTKDITIDKSTVKNYNDYLNDALKNRAEILNDTENLKLAKIQFDITKASYPYKTQAKYIIAQYSVTAAENQLDTDKTDISISINSLYNDLQSKIQKLQPKTENYNSEKKKYDQYLQKYNLGMISKVDYLDELASLMSAENSLKTAQRDAALAKLKIEYASGIGTEAQ